MRGLFLLTCLALASIAAFAAADPKLTDQMKVVNYAVGPLVIGRVFTVSVTLNDYLATLPGTRRWFVIREDYDSNNPSCQGVVSGVDFPFLLLYQVFGQLPGSPDYRPGCKMYDNVTVIEEKVDGNTLTAKLQINDPSDEILGRVRLVCLFVDHPPASIDEGMDANASWDFIYSEIKSVRELFFQPRSKLMPAQRQAVTAALAVTIKTPEGLPKNLREEMLTIARDQVMAQHKEALNRDQLAMLKDEQQVWANLQRKANYYSGMWTSITVKPFRLAVEKPNGWNEDGDTTNWTTCSLKKIVSQTTASGNIVRANSTLLLEISHDNYREKIFNDTKPGGYSKPTPITAGDFTGFRCTWLSPKSAESESRTDLIFMRYGGLYLYVRLKLYAGGPSNDFHPVFEMLRMEAESIIASLRITPGE